MKTKSMVPTGTVSTPLSTRDRILHAAIDLFMERGFAETTTLDIASRARVSKRELYKLVGNKNEMLAICIARRGERMRLPEGFPTPSETPSLEAVLRTYGATLLREITDPAVLEVFRIGIAEAKRSPAIARTLNERGRGPARGALEALLKSARDAKVLVDEDLSTMMSRYRGMLWGDRLVWILLGITAPPNAKEIKQQAEEVARLFLRLYGRKD